MSDFSGKINKLSCHGGAGDRGISTPLLAQCSLRIWAGGMNCGMPLCGMSCRADAKVMTSRPGQ